MNTRGVVGNMTTWSKNRFIFNWPNRRNHAAWAFASLLAALSQGCQPSGPASTGPTSKGRASANGSEAARTGQEGTATTPVSISSTRYPLPDESTYENLTEFSKRIMATEPAGADAFERREDQKSQISALATAASRMIALASTDEQKEVAQEQFLGAHLILALIGSDSDEQAARQLVEAKDDALSEAIRQKGRRFFEQQFAPRRLQEAMNLLISGGAKATGDVVKAAQRMAHAKNPTSMHASMLTQAENYLELFGSYDAARQIAVLLRERLGALPDDKVSQFAIESSEKALKRLGFLGNPLRVQASDLNGNTIDTAQFAGKVILVDFWATFCAPCLEELPNLRKTYAKYHDQGFEVVSIALDQERADLEMFLKENSIPWFVGYSTDATRRGVDGDPSAIACGVTRLPTTFLIDRQGRVAAMHLRGDKLEQEVAKSLASESADSAAPNNKAPR